MPGRRSAALLASTPATARYHTPGGAPAPGGPRPWLPLVAVAIAAAVGVAAALTVLRSGGDALLYAVPAPSATILAPAPALQRPTLPSSFRPLYAAPGDDPLPAGTSAPELEQQPRAAGPLPWQSAEAPRRPWLLSLATAVGAVVGLAAQKLAAEARTFGRVPPADLQAPPPATPTTPATPAVAVAPFSLPPLAWSRNALEPHISAETIDYHYGKHHQAYITKLNELLTQPEHAQWKGQSLDAIVRGSSGIVFNQAAQIWNHNFYWSNLRPNPEGKSNEPSGPVKALIERDFGSFAAFQEQFTGTAVGHFGSGWVWLVSRPDGALRITQGHDALNPVKDGSGVPLLTCDVWEHAYYIDRRNARPAYVKAWWNVVDWDAVNARLPAPRVAMLAMSGARRSGAPPAAPAIAMAATTGAIELPPLPWDRTALAPHISAETIDYHYGKHHQAYVTKLNELLGQPEHAQWRGQPLDAIVRGSSGIVFNQAAQIWNHNFYWSGLRPNPEGKPNEPSGRIRALIERDFGSFAAFQEQFTGTAVGHFGSGWVWLVSGPDDALRITQGHDALNPVKDGSGVPLLTCDVWEHAYYVDRRNARPAYVQAWWQVVDWDFVNRNLPQ